MSGDAIKYVIKKMKRRINIKKYDLHFPFPLKNSFLLYKKHLNFNKNSYFLYENKNFAIKKKL